MRAAVLSLLGLLAGCNGALYTRGHGRGFEVTDRDFRSIAKVAFKLIDPKDTITTVVVPPGTDPRARAALKSLKTLISPAQIPQSRDYKLPGGYFVVHDFTIADGEATLEGQLGPVTNSMTAANMPDCGRNYSIAFYIEGNDWVSHAYKMATCAESRHWTPIDDPPAQQAGP